MPLAPRDRQPHDDPPKLRPGAGRLSWRIWLAIGIAAGILLLVVYLPSLAQMGPSRKGECARIQRSLEALAKKISEWETQHPQSPPINLTDCQNGYQTGIYKNSDSESFTKHIGQKSSLDTTADNPIYLLTKDVTLHRDYSASPEIQIEMPFQYSRGKDDPWFILKSWDRAPMDEYMKWAQRQENYKIIKRAMIPGLLLTLVLTAILGSIAQVASHLVARKKPRNWLGHCACCGYSLHGNPSPSCPECGQIVSV